MPGGKAPSQGGAAAHAVLTGQLTDGDGRKQKVYCAGVLCWVSFEPHVDANCGNDQAGGGANQTKPKSA